eukprot:SAG31_NODE_15586_length_748_cov_0.502311_1_plen_113_part_10
MKFVSSMVVTLEADQPEAFAQLHSKGRYSMDGLQVSNEDKKIRWRGTLLFDPERASGLTVVAPSFHLSHYVEHSSTATVDVVHQDCIACYNDQNPYIRELPEALFDLIAMDPD